MKAITSIITTSSSALLLMLAGPVAPQTDIDPSMIGAKNVLYSVITGGLFMCIDEGARCVYQKTHFSDVDVGSGQDTVNIEGDVWAANDISSVLEVGTCTEQGGCFVKCNANCTCTIPGTGDPPQNCTMESTRAPTTPPPTPAPVPQICPEQKNKEHCPELMKRVPSNNFFDCYNFCGGIFTSICVFSGNCGELSCPNATADGTFEGEVWGCTDAVDAPGRRPSGLGYGPGTDTPPDGNNGSGAFAVQKLMLGGYYSLMTTASIGTLWWMIMMAL